ncbi:glycosyltransferase family 2 protein [Zobellella denitrificans]
MNNIPVPKVSVIIPAYNAQRVIGRTIQSVVEQTFTDWEIIVIDDHSTDDTRKIVGQWSAKDVRIRVVSLSRNFGGPAGPRNVGVRLAKGHYIAFLDADDIWHPHKLEIQIDLMEREKAPFVCSKMKDFTCDKNVNFSNVGEISYQKISFKQQSIRARIPTSSVVITRDLLLKHPFNEDSAYKAVEDYHCWLMLLESLGGCLKINVSLLYYRKIEGQISGSKINMMRKVFMVHREYPNRSVLESILFTFCHVFGGLYFRFLKKGM